MVHPLTVLLLSLLILPQLLNADAQPKKSTEAMAAHFRMATKAFIGHPHEEYSNEEEEEHKEEEHKPLDKHKSDEKTISDRLRAELKSYYDGNEENVCKWVAILLRMAKGDIAVLKKIFEEKAEKMDLGDDGFKVAVKLFSGTFTFLCPDNVQQGDPNTDLGKWQVNCRAWEMLWSPFKQWIHFLAILKENGFGEQEADLKLILMHLSVRPLLVEENEDHIDIYVNSLYAFLEIRSNGIGYTGKKPPQWNNFESWAIVNGWTQSCREGFAHGGIGSAKYMEAFEHLKHLYKDEHAALAGQKQHLDNHKTVDGMQMPHPHSVPMAHGHAHQQGNGDYASQHNHEYHQTQSAHFPGQSAHHWDNGHNHPTHLVPAGNAGMVH